ncbi:hypothetical protein [Flavobacterium sp. ZT3R18]|uniref:hypothetical protein n=1 Tax=Flavobacterium sp. ZT3R18 TaxID=2594429 RepID=UPI00163DBB35|nr:hypothetical protein [Flavobacterium sp. ZT3R18]
MIRSNNKPKMNNQEATPEDEVMKRILEEIEKYKNNQNEFKEAIDDFILKSNEILDDE